MWKIQTLWTNNQTCEQQRERDRKKGKEKKNNIPSIFTSVESLESLEKTRISVNQT